MSEEKMVLIPIEISNTITSTLGTLYDPIFQNVDIYGTFERPLFNANDVADLFGIKDANIRKKDMIANMHYIEAKAKKGGTTRSRILLTTTGLIKMIFASHNPLALKFQTYISVVMERLRIHQTVTIEDAASDYHEEIGRLRESSKELNKLLKDTQDKLKRTEEDLEWEHEQLNRAKRQIDVEFENRMYSEENEEKLQMQIQHYHNQYDYNELNEQLNLMREKYMKKIYVVLQNPPAHLRDEHDYDVDAEEPTVDDAYIFSISQTLTAAQKNHSHNIFYIHKDQTIDQVKSALDARGFRVMKNLTKKDKDSDEPKYMTNKYDTSLAEIEDIIRDMTHLPLKNKITEVDPVLKDEEV